MGESRGTSAYRRKVEEGSMTCLVLSQSPLEHLFPSQARLQSVRSRAAVELWTTHGIRASRIITLH